MMTFVARYLINLSRFMLAFSLSSATYAHVEKFSNTEALKSAKTLEQIKFEPGGLLLLGQIQREENLGSVFLVTQECTDRAGKLACKVVRIDGNPKK